MPHKTTIQMERFRLFPPRSGSMRIPMSSRGAALAGMSTYPACRPRALWAQRVAWVGVKIFGPRFLLGPDRTWEPPVPDDIWDRMIAEWRSELGDFDTAAVYQRATRAGFALLLIREGEALAYLKIRTDETANRREVQAVQAVDSFRPKSFSTPRFLSSGRVAEWSYFATEALPTRIYHPPVDPPIRAIVNEVQAALVDLPRESEIPQHWVAAHGDLAPWNLREDPAGNLILFDWENWGWAPPGADEVLYQLVDTAIRNRNGFPPNSPEAIRFWRSIFQRRSRDPDMHPLASMMEAILERWESAPDLNGAVR